MSRTAIALLLLCLVVPPARAAASVKKRKHQTAAKPKAHVGTATHSTSNTTRRPARRHVQPMPVFDPTAGDNVDGDDLAVRRAAVEALGNYNGTVVVVDPQSGRILTIVNQKTALESGFTPCSTIKLVTAFAALNEGLVERDTPLRLTRRTSLDLSAALAHSNNPYFKILGERLGFERTVHYARLFGLGEKAGWHIEGERAGLLPEAAPQSGSVGMMTAFGEGIQLTPLELAAMLSAIANGGTLYYLQYPRGEEEIEHFVPRVKRHLEIGRWISDVKVGMRAAVDSGTAHRAGYDPNEPILGKTGTCHDSRALNHLGWFGSFNDVEHHPLVVVVLLTAGFRINGPIAAGVAGVIYKELSQENFFARANLVSTQMCCTR
jgi:cell division protein FtsI/penicillin-binding protein 2